MSESPNSTLNSHPKATEATEATADLSQNLDEVLDLELGFGALGGLRHSASCEATERSQRRYDNRNHRLHESRMNRLGMEDGESDEPEDEDMSQQVLIRSPITHHHHYEQPATPTPEPAAPAQQPADPKSNWLGKAAVAAALLAGGAGAGVGASALLGAFDKPQPASQGVDTDTDTIPTVIIKPHTEE